MLGAWVISPVSVRDEERIAYVSTLEDKTRPRPQPDLGLPYVVYENYRTSDVVSVHLDVIGWALSFVRTESFSNLKKDPYVHFVFGGECADGEYFLGRTLLQVGLWSELDAIADGVESVAEEVKATDFRELMEEQAQLWLALAEVGAVLQPGWTPHGTYVGQAPFRRSRR